MPAFFAYELGDGHLRLLLQPVVCINKLTNM
jgi:hypothetical protein